MSAHQILTAQQMQDAEQKLFDDGMSVETLMEVAASGAAEWVRRIAAGRSVTVLCGPGNNGGDGYVIARLMRGFGNSVQVVAPIAPKTDAGKNARELWDGEVLTSGGSATGEVFVDCLFGSGLSRPLLAEHALLLRDLADRATLRIAIDVPSGIASDTGKFMADKLPHFDVTLALGSWKFAHCLVKARSIMGVRRLVPIGIGAVDGAAHRIVRPMLNAPTHDAHKYTRGLCAVVGGEMQGAGLLAAKAAMRSGAGYVKFLGQSAVLENSHSLVVENRDLEDAICDKRISAILVGPGLGRSDVAAERLRTALKMAKPTVLDADALHLISPAHYNFEGPIIATPHDGELSALCKAFSVIADGRMERAQAVSKASGMVVVAKGPDTFVASPDGRVGIGPPGSSWLSTAGTGDVLAGLVASRLATGREPFDAACDAVWLHSEAARQCAAPFTADDLVESVSSAVAKCL